MKILNKIEEGICILCLIAMTTLVFANVFSRFRCVRQTAYASGQEHSFLSLDQRGRVRKHCF